MPSNMICLRVPLKSYSRIRTARMSPKIIRDALQIREKHEMNKNKKNKETQHDQILERIVKIESALQTMEIALKVITEKLAQQ